MDEQTESAPLPLPDTLTPAPAPEPARPAATVQEVFQPETRQFFKDLFREVLTEMAADAKPVAVQVLPTPAAAPEVAVSAGGMNIDAPQHGSMGS
jgi:hypothetical protein